MPFKRKRAHSKRRRVFRHKRAGKKHGALMAVVNRPVSKGVAPALGVGAIARLLATPLSDGDSWLRRAQQTIEDPSTFTDGAGNNPFSIFALQVQDNALGAIEMGIEAAVVRWAGRKVGI
jgi:hypothetical protein